MSWRRGGGNSKGKQVCEVNSPKVKAEKLSDDVAQISLGSAPPDDGEWEVIGRKSKNRAGSSAAPAAKQIQLGPQNSNSKCWSHQDVRKLHLWSANDGSQTTNSQKPAGRGKLRQQSYSNVAPQHVIHPPLDHGWNWKSRAGNNDNDVTAAVDDDDNEDSDAVSDTDEYDDELLSDDEFESDSSAKSHGTRKKSRWFKEFFETLDGLSADKINDPGRPWHCPACKGGPGAIDRYQGLQPLMRHAETKGSKRVKLHRELAQLLDAELQIRGTSVIPAGVTFGKWVSFKDEEKDLKIVWPPVVVIMNTRLEKDENDKWIGMGTEELLYNFSSYPALKAKHSYGPQGHCGMSILMFEASEMGYFEAERLHKHFAEQGLGRNAWERSPVLFRPGGIRQLYGYMAVKQDLDMFNQHSEDKSKLKYEMRLYQEMVLHPMRKMKENSQQVIWMKNRVSTKKDVEELLRIVSEKLFRTQEENRILRQRTKVQHKETKEEMDEQEQFYKDLFVRSVNNPST